MYIKVQSKVNKCTIQTQELCYSASGVFRINALMSPLTAPSLLVRIIANKYELVQISKHPQQDLRTFYVVFHNSASRLITRINPEDSTKVITTYVEHDQTQLKESYDKDS